MKKDASLFPILIGIHSTHSCTVTKWQGVTKQKKEGKDGKHIGKPRKQLGKT